MSRAIEKHGEVQLDKSRVTLLLEINTELLREVLLVQPNFKNTEEAKNDPTFREYESFYSRALTIIFPRCSIMFN
jgi:hypothetical protein